MNQKSRTRLVTRLVHAGHSIISYSHDTLNGFSLRLRFNILSCTKYKKICNFSLVHKLQSYSCCMHRTQAVRRGLYVECIKTHAHGRQKPPLFSQSDVNMWYCILVYSGTSGSIFQKSQWWERKWSDYLHEHGIENIRPSGYCSSLLGNRWSSRRIFLSHPHTYGKM